MAFFVFQTYKTSGPTLSDAQTWFLTRLSREMGVPPRQLEIPFAHLLQYGYMDNLSSELQGRIGGYLYNELVNPDGFGLVTLTQNNRLVLQYGGKDVSKYADNNMAKQAALTDLQDRINTKYKARSPSPENQPDEKTEFVQKDTKRTDKRIEETQKDDNEPAKKDDKKTTKKDEKKQVKKEDKTEAKKEPKEVKKAEQAEVKIDELVEKKDQIQTAEPPASRTESNINPADINSSTFNKTVPILQTSVAPNVMLDTQYGKAMLRIKDLLDRLSHYSTYDDLKTLDSLRLQLSEEFKGLQDQLSRLDDDSGQRSSYEQRLARDAQTIRKDLSPYWANVLRADGTLDESELYARGSGLVTTVLSLQALDQKLNLVLQGPVSQADLESMRSLYNSLRNHPNELQYLMGQRYGSEGEGLAPTRSILGLGLSHEPSAVQYLEVVRSLIETQRADLWGMSQMASSRYPESYKTLSTAQIDVLAPNTGSLSRDAFDPVSRLAYLRLVTGDMSERFDDSQINSMLLTLRGTYTYNDVSQSQMWSASIPPGMAYLIFSRPFFNNVLAPMPDAGLRQQIFNQAAILLSSVYGVSDPKNRYADTAELMGRFEKLSASGDLVSDMEVSNTYGLERGHIGQRAPWQQVQIPYQQQDLSTLWMFANSMLRPPSYFAYQNIPQVNPYSPLQNTNLNYLMDYEKWEQNRFLSTMPNAWYLTTQYSPNYLGRYANYGMVLGEMNEAFHAILSRGIRSFEPLSGSLEGQTSGNESHTAADIRATSQGRAWGQRAYAEVFGDWGVTKASTYSPTSYSEFDEGRSERQFATLQANLLQVLGTNVWQALTTFNRNYGISEHDSAGNPISVGGLADEHSDWNLRNYLNSTFPLASDGMTIAFVNYSGQDLTPTLGPLGGGEQKSTLNYDVDIFTKKGKTWVRTIDKGRTRDLLQSNVGAETTLGDGVKQYFAQLYSQMGSTTRLTTAAEIDERYYNINPLASQPTNTRLGAMLIFQPGVDAAVGAVKTTTDDWSVLFGSDTKASMVHGGFYSFNPAVTPLLMRGDRSVGLGAANYYYPTYELDEVQPPDLPNLTAEKRIYALSGTWLMLEEFRASLFAGWKGDDRSVLTGGKLDTKNSNLGAFFHFDQNRYLSEAVITGGGRFKKLDLGAAELEDVRTRAYATRTDQNEEVAGSMTFKAGEGELSISGRFNSNRTPANNTLLADRTARSIYDGWNSYNLKLGQVTIDQVLDKKQRAPLFRGLMEDAQKLASDGIQRLPIDDLYSAWLANFSVAYHSPTSSWVGTTAITEDGGTFLSGLYNYRNRVSFIGGVRIGGDEAKTPDNAYKWLLGGKIRPSDDLAFSLYIAPTKDDRMIGGIGGEIRDVASASISGGHEYYNAYLSLGPRQYMGHFDLLRIGGMQSQEVGGRLALNAVTYLTMAYRQITTPGLQGFDPLDPLVQQALKQNLLPDRLNYEQFKIDLDFDLGNKNRATLTGQLSKVRGPGMPYDFYYGIGWSMSPF